MKNVVMRLEKQGYSSMFKRLSISAILAVSLLAAPNHVKADAAGDGSEGIRLLRSAADVRVLPGTTRPRREVVLSSNFDATLMRICVEEGQRVRAGELVARLDDRVVRASLMLAKQEAEQVGRINRAQAVVDRSQRILDRTQAAFRSNAANHEEIAEAKTNLAVAVADLTDAEESHEASRFRLVQAEARLAEHEIRAPFDGVVLRRVSEEGSVLRSGDPIAELASIDAMCVDLYLPAVTAIEIELNALYALSLDAPFKKVVWARARYVEQRIDPTSNTMRVVFDFEAPERLIPAGLLVVPADRLPNAQELAFLKFAKTEPTLVSVHPCEE